MGFRYILRNIRLLIQNRRLKSHILILPMEPLVLLMENVQAVNAEPVQILRQNIVPMLQRRVGRMAERATLPEILLVAINVSQLGHGCVKGGIIEAMEYALLQVLVTTREIAAILERNVMLVIMVRQLQIL
jgi:hypothetical protein